MKITTPGVSFYASQVKENRPFTLVRYGEGDLRLAVPTLTAKGDDPHSRGLKEERANAHLWARPGDRHAFRSTLAHLYDSPRYWVALWHLGVMKRSHRLGKIEAWLTQVGQIDREFHDGSVWRVAIEKRQLGEMMDAIRSQPLPIVVVAPKRMNAIKKRLPVARFVPTTFPCGLDYVPALMEGVLEVGKPSLIIVCAAAAGKVLIHRLFPLIGEESFMIDFGASLDGLCGNRVRRYHGPRVLPSTAIERNWGHG